MTYLEIVQKCAEAMGYSDVRRKGDQVTELKPFGKDVEGIYWPLEDDAQAMALVKRFRLDICASKDSWQASYDGVCYTDGSKELNRAICECVANMQRARSL